MNSFNNPNRESQKASFENFFTIKCLNSFLKNWWNFAIHANSSVFREFMIKAIAILNKNRKVPKSRYEKMHQPGAHLVGSGGSGSTTGMATGLGGDLHHMHHSSTVSYQTGAFMNKNSQVSRRSAVTKSSMDEDAMAAAAQLHQSDDESMQFLSNYELIMNSTEFFSGLFGLSYAKCFRCESRLEIYSEDIIGSLIVICSMAIHREVNLVAPLLIDMIIPIMRYMFYSHFNAKLNSINSSFYSELLRRKCSAGKWIAISICLATIQALLDNSWDALCISWSTIKYFINFSSTITKVNWVESCKIKTTFQNLNKRIFYQRFGFTRSTGCLP